MVICRGEEEGVALFDAWAETYDSWYRTEIGSIALEAEKKVLSGLIPFRNMCYSRVLDVGCGTGEITFALADLKLSVFGVDNSEEMLKIALEKLVRFNRKAYFLLADVEALPFDDCTFDAVVANVVFEFLENPKRAFAEMMRVTKRGGYVIIGFINGKSRWAKFYKREAEKLGPDSIYYYANFFSLEDVKRLFGRPEKVAYGLYFSPNEFNAGRAKKSEVRKEVSAVSTLLGRAAGLLAPGYFAVRYRKPA